MKNGDVIGGEYAIDRAYAIQVHGLNSKPTDYYASGRTAFYVILRAIYDQIGSGCMILIPDYLCSSIVSCIDRCGINYDYYHVNDLFYPDESMLFDKASKCNSVLLINYFGLIDLGDIQSKLRANNEELIIIVDDVQNYYGFGKEELCDYAFTSFRKWFPLPDGAMIKNNTNNKIITYTKENGYYKYKFAGNVLKNYKDIIGDDIALDLLKTGEKYLDENYDGACSEYSFNGYMNIDFDGIAQIRKSNARILHEGLSEMGVEHIWNEDDAVVPLFVPVIMRNGRDELRKLLFDNAIYCPIHWIYMEGKMNFPKNNLSDYELSLICDHRYGSDDMHKQLEIIRKWM